MSHAAPQRNAFLRLTPHASLAVRWSRPISRVLSRTVIHLGYTSPCTSSNLPGNGAGRTIVSLFGLAPGGVFPATTVANRAVRSYRTISPLPASWRYIFCGTFRRLAPPRRYLASCPMEPGLSSPRLSAKRLSGRLPDQIITYSGADRSAWIKGMTLQQKSIRLNAP